MLISLNPKINIITMINTNELMLGNLVEYKGGYGLITAIRTHHVNVLVDKYEHTKVPFEDINPIELTDDVVSKLGGTENHKTWRVLHHWQNAGTINYPEGGALDITPLITPKPILKTHDGVDMFDKNAEVWVCYKRGMNEFDSKDNPGCDTVARQIINPFRDELLLFSSKSSCQAYIDQKWAETHPEPLLVTRDGVKVYDKGAWVYICYEDATNMYYSDVKDAPSTKRVSSYLIEQYGKPILVFSTRELAQSYIDQKWAEAHPKPIFVTEDGVGIFYGDTYYYCRKSGFWGKLKGYVCCNNTANSYSGNDADYAYFSTEELTQTYLNKMWADKEYDDLISKFKK